MSEKTPEEMAKKEVNKRVGKALSDIEIERRKLKAKIKKLDKKEKKILDGELVPGDGSIIDDDDEDNDSSSIKVNFLLDESGSMGSCLDQTISGFNEYISTLKKEKKRIKFTLTKFEGNNINIMWNNIDISKVPKLNTENYVPAGMTPLYDAIGRTVNKDKKDGKTLFVIMTDGYENASHEFTSDMVTELIKGQEKIGWTFVYLGADQDAWANSQKLGLSKGNTLAYCSMNTKKTYGMLANSTIGYAANKKIKTNTFFKDNKTKGVTTTLGKRNKTTKFK